MLTSLLPIGDDNEGRVLAPFVTYFLIAANVAVFVLLQAGNPYFTYGYSVIPREIVTGVDIVSNVRTPLGLIPEAPGPHPIFLTIFTAMFMHGGWSHLLGNMLYLWIFGDNVEDAMGHRNFLMFYLVCGAAAAAAQIIVAPFSLIPCLGASGAIAGVLGAYLVLYPTRNVRVLVGCFGIVGIPAIIVIGFWIVTQVLNGFGQIAVTQQTSGGGVAYAAHVGGVLAGLLLVSTFRSGGMRQRVAARTGYPPGY